jgi:hypothetical protein
MKFPTLYVIVEIGGKTFKVTDQGREKVDLNQLLEDGWKPVSETSMGAGAAVLIRLERDHEGPSSFGFGSA